MKKIIAAAVAVVLSIGIAGCSTPTTVEQMEPEMSFQSVVDACGESLGFSPGDWPTRDAVFTVVSDGIAMHADGNHQFEAMMCVLNGLGASPIMIAQMERTSSLMGVQSYSDEKAGLEYVWTYHPDNGMNVTVERS